MDEEIITVQDSCCNNKNSHSSHKLEQVFISVQTNTHKAQFNNNFINLNMSCVYQLLREDSVSFHIHIQIAYNKKQAHNLA